jgi:nicotinamidase/pyrazinamidase
MKCLLIVDVQNDFCPGGALGVSDGDRVVPVINAMMDRFELVVASKDWHPPETVHFDKWPVHCVRDTHGSEFHPKLRTDRIAQVFFKGTRAVDDGYSAFEATNMSLEKYLADHAVDSLYITGLATDYCVLQSSLYAVAKGLRTFVVTDGVAAVDVKPGDGDRALRQMKVSGVTLITSADVPF